ncbi:5-formyltetrahydrofolate cyclo-ligase [Sphingosinicella sp. LHD-64]|uniref:5-formyltetrahydrofolate cyclo-ligase n=1 Tax=Sphingosinicella sp. LHD-64 TaxID=3072139 RepID=UPI00280E7734|nr:5-formyltetrahydrofolate cyclo-ligase [Sphingosinicella sp. LHD-64]MDQ8754738.1 5-formyltetrahydrofolate cyclo-ligase [Sphingosinicella sp. LHD-64]
MAVPSPPSSGKADLRAEGLRRRRDLAASLTPELRAALEDQLARQVFPRLAGARVIGAYHPLREEISPYPLLALLEGNQRIGLPWFAARDARMIWREAPAVEAGPWGVLQPPAGAEALAPDAVLVPIVLADRRGTRIGHGKGHYDRALAHLRESGPVLTIGLAWERQISDEPIPADPWDMRLDAVATPKEWIPCA